MADIQFDYEPLEKPQIDKLDKNAHEIAEFFRELVRRLPRYKRNYNTLPRLIDIEGVPIPAAEDAAKEIYDFLAKILEDHEDEPEVPDTY